MGIWSGHRGYTPTLYEKCQESRPGVLLLIARGRHLPSSWTHQLHSTHLFTPHITPSWSQSVNYLYTSPPSLCLARLPYPHSLVYVFVVFCVGYCTDYIRFRAFGTPALRCRLGCPVPDYCFVFCLLAFDLMN